MNISTSINGAPINAFVDTGATISVISSKLANKLRIIPIPNSSIFIRQLDGRTRSIGRAEISLTIKNITHRVTVHIVAAFAYPLLIGLDVGEKFRLKIDLFNRTITTNSHDNSPIICTANDADNDALQQLLVKWKSVFGTHDHDIGRITIARHAIHTVTHRPIYLRPHRLAIDSRDKLQEQVNKLLRDGQIRHSTSQYAFPIIGVPKKDGSLRLVIDYRKLNAVTIPDKLPMPRVDDVLDRLHGARYFSTLDISWGYWHIAMDPDSIEKTAFVTNQGHYEWLVMPMGLMNASSTFQRTIQQILGDLLYNGAINYLDDIIVYSKTQEEHFELLNSIMDKLVRNNIKLKRKKCEFMRSEVTYLGYTVSHNRVRPAQQKVEAILKFPTPKSAHDIRRLVGMGQYYRRFIPHYSQMVKPLTDLTRKDQPFVWGRDQQLAFEKVIQALSNEPVLNIYNPEQPCILHTDASKVGIGATLLQRDGDGTEHPIAYFSRQLDQAQKNYTASELECLAVVQATKHFDAYLGLPFSIITDHRALQWLLSFKDPKSRLYRWAVHLSTYKFTIKHRAGAQMNHVDALSRAPIINYLREEDLRSAQAGEDLSFIRDPIIKNGITGIRWNGEYRVFVPSRCRTELCRRVHDEYGHPGKQKTLRMIAKHHWWPRMTADIQKYTESCRTCQITKTTHTPTPGKYVLPEGFAEPLETVALDTVVMGSAADGSSYKYIHVFVDHHSRFVWAYPAKSCSADTYCNLLQKLHSSGIHMQRLLTDCHLSFRSSKFRKCLDNLQIKRSHSTPYHPQSNGVVERVNGTLITRLRATIVDNPRSKWTTLLQQVVRQYNQTPHDVTGYTPEFLLFGINNTPTYVNNHTSLEEARGKANERTRAIQSKNKRRHDAVHPDIEFKLGVKVLRIVPRNHPSLDKLSPRWEGPFRIHNKVGPVTYDIQDDNGSTYRAHASQLKLFIERYEAPLTPGACDR